MEMAVTVSSSPNLESVCDGKISPKDEDENAKILLIKQLQAAQQIRGRKMSRKRRHSVAEECASSQSMETKSHPVKQRRGYSGHTKRGYAGDIILPTNFLLGGNISDPLNLNSLLDENVNKALNAVTPSSSPLPPRSSKISIVIPTDMTDPLGLNFDQEDQSESSTVDKNVEGVSSASGKPIQKKKKKRRKSLHEKAIPSLPQNAESDMQLHKEDSSSVSNFKENIKMSKHRKSNSKLLKIESDESTKEPQSQLTISVSQVSSNIVDPIVSPVVPQDVKRSSIVFSPKSKKRKSLSLSNTKEVVHDKSNDSDKPLNDNVTANENDAPETLGEQLLSEIKAARLKSNVRSKVTLVKDNKPQQDHGKRSITFKPSNSRFQYGNYTKYYGYRNPQKFQDDRMGCLKKEWFKDKDVLDVGCNVGHLTLLIARDFSPRKIVGVDIDEGLIKCARKNVRHYATAETRPPSSKISKFPESVQTLYGPITGPPVENAKDNNADFPNNVIFLQGNYVPEKEEVLQCQEPEYDVILCMSVTKWVHLNWGDDGLTKTFKRFFKQLRPGGKLILEPQEWKSYTKKKNKLTETIYNNYYSIKLKPESFPRYLIDEVGFERVEFLKQPERKEAKGG